MYMRSNRLLNNARSSFLNTSNSSFVVNTRQDKENCLEDMLALVLGPEMRVSQVLDLSSHPTVHLGRLELGEQLVHHEGLILL
jgi:hypothetical protein